MTTNHAQQLMEKAEKRTAVIGIVGLGYVGLPLAMEMAEAGFTVLGFDISKRVVDKLNAGNSHVQDIPSARLGKAVKAGKFSATTDLARMTRAGLHRDRGADAAVQGPAIRTCPTSSRRPRAWRVPCGRASSSSWRAPPTPERRAT